MVVDMEAAQVVHDLSSARCPISDLDAPKEAGVYAIFLQEGAVLPGVQKGRDGLLYIGLSTNLAQRQYDTHFQAGKTGFSTVRRSLGALLIELLGLQPRPRGSGSSATNYTNYRFDEAGEDRLSAWMSEHLEVAVRPAKNPEQLEKDLLREARPPLNLKDWPNPGAPAIKALRKKCVQAAKATEPR